MKTKLLKLISLMMVISLLFSISACSDEKKNEKKEIPKWKLNDPSEKEKKEAAVKENPAKAEEKGEETEEVEEKLLEEEQIPEDAEKIEESTGEEIDVQEEIEVSPPDYDTEIKIDEIALPDYTVEEEPEESTSPVESFVKTDGPALEAVINEGLSQSGLDCTSKIRAEGDSLVVNMKMPMFDSATTEQISMMENSFNSMKDELKGMLGDLGNDVPGLKKIVYEFSNSSNETVIKLDIAVD